MSQQLTQHMSQPQNDKKMAELIKAFNAKVPDDMPLTEFLRVVGKNCVCVERFVGTQQVYFTGEPFKKSFKAFGVRRCKFGVEIRSTQVLVLSVKGKKFVSLDEAVQIVHVSPLQQYLSEIELIAVDGNSETKKQSHSIHRVTAHIFVKFTSKELAKKCINVVDAFPFGPHFVHSPQVASREFQMSQDYCSSSPNVWMNKMVADNNKLNDSSSLSHSDNLSQHELEETTSAPDGNSVNGSHTDSLNSSFYHFPGKTGDLTEIDSISDGSERGAEQGQHIPNVVAPQPSHIVNYSNIYPSELVASSHAVSNTMYPGNCYENNVYQAAPAPVDCGPAYSDMMCAVFFS